MNRAFLFVVAVLILSEINGNPQGQRQQGARSHSQNGFSGVQTGQDRGKPPGQDGKEIQDQGAGPDLVHGVGGTRGQEFDINHEHKEKQGGEQEEEQTDQEAGQGVNEEGEGDKGHEQGPGNSAEPKGSEVEGKQVAGAGEGNSVRESPGAGTGLKGGAGGRSGRT